MPPPTSVRELDDDSVALLLEAYIDRAGAGDPLVLLSAPVAELCAALYGPGRSGPDGDVDEDRRVFKHVCAKLGLAALPAYAGAPTTWYDLLRALRAEMAQLDADDRDDFRRVVRRKPYSYTLLLEASRDGRALVVTVILAHVSTAVVDACGSNGVTSLMLASNRDRLSVVGQLLAARADVDARDEGDCTALLYASRHSHVVIVRALLAAGAGVDAGRARWEEYGENGETALMEAFSHGRTDVMTVLIAAGADLNVRDNLGATLLMRVSKYGDAATVQMLLAAGDRVDARDEDGNTALMRAFGLGNDISHWQEDVNVMRTLIAADADVNARNHDEWTALMGASYEGLVDTVQVLLENSANVNAATNDGETALRLATKEGHAAVVRVLLARDGVVVDPGQRDRILKVMREADEALVDEAIRRAAA